MHLYEHPPSSPDLPRKQEFLIDISLSPEQEQCYKAFLEACEQRGVPSGSNKENQVPAGANGSNHFRDARYSPAFTSPCKPVPQPHDNQFTFVRSALLNRWGNPNVDELRWHRIDVMISILEHCRDVGDKILIFSHGRGILKYIRKILTARNWPCYLIDRNTASKQRIIDDFTKDDKPAMLLLSTTAGGVGLNIQAANRVIIFDFQYTPTEEEHAIGRVYRFGQMKPVTVYWLMSSTFEVSVQNNAAHL